MKTIYTDLVWCSVLALVFATVLPGAALAEDVIFADASLENIVRRKLGIPSPTIITDTDMETLVALNTYGRSISNLQGLEYATNLGILFITVNQTSDLSALSGMTKMSILGLNCNQISDLSALSGMTNMNWLFLGNNQISDISALSGLMKMSELSIGNNQISDVSVVSGMTRMKDLYLNHNQIETMNLSGSNLHSLRYFHIYGNPLKKVLLADARLSQSTFDVLMDGGGSAKGIAELGGVLTLDMSGVDFAGLLDLSSMYGMDDLEELLLAGAINIDGGDLCLLTEELASLNWLDITGAWDGFDMVTQDWLNSWDAVDGNTLVTPEPCSMALLGLGALVIRRRKTA